jgi:hypothetical protein
MRLGGPQPKPPHPPGAVGDSQQEKSGMTYFSIKYCQKRNGEFINVRPDIARYFRVFMLTGTGDEWVHDFTMLSKANTFIEKMREAEINLHEGFTAIIAGEQVMQEESVRTVMDMFKQDIIKEGRETTEEFFRHKKFMEELGRLS